MFTPYITIGAGIFNYDPFAYLNNVKYALRPLGTEGQGSAAYPEREAYGNVALCFPLGMGVKYNISPSVNFAFEISYRFTTTDYLDDVSTTYAGITNFHQITVMLLLLRNFRTGLMKPELLSVRQAGNVDSVNKKTSTFLPKLVWHLQ
jgi:hypothetical protein